MTTKKELQELNHHLIMFIKEKNIESEFSQFMYIRINNKIAQEIGSIREVKK